MTCTVQYIGDFELSGIIGRKGLTSQYRYIFIKYFIIGGGKEALRKGVPYLVVSLILSARISGRLKFRRTKLYSIPLTCAFEQLYSIPLTCAFEQLCFMAFYIQKQQTVTTLW